MREPKCDHTFCTHKAGELAYLDTFSGVLPVTVLEVAERGFGHRVAGGTGLGKIKVRLNVTRGSYKRGEVVEAKAHDVVPRKHHRYSRGQGRISDGYVWVTERIAGTTYTVTYDEATFNANASWLVRIENGAEWHTPTKDQGEQTAERYIATQV